MEIPLTKHGLENMWPDGNMGPRFPEVSPLSRQHFRPQAESPQLKSEQVNCSTSGESPAGFPFVLLFLSRESTRFRQRTTLPFSKMPWPLAAATTFLNRHKHPPEKEIHVD
jgi:hypothetical protein